MSKFQFSQALGHLSALIQSALSFCVPHSVLCSTRLCLCFIEFWSFFSHSANLLLFCQQSHLPSADAFFSSQFYEFFFINRNRYFLDIFHFYFYVLGWRTIFVFYGTQIYVLIMIIIIIAMLEVIKGLVLDFVLYFVTIWQSTLYM